MLGRALMPPHPPRDAQRNSHANCTKPKGRANTSHLENVKRIHALKSFVFKRLATVRNSLPYNNSKKLAVSMDQADRCSFQSIDRTKYRLFAISKAGLRILIFLSTRQIPFSHIAICGSGPLSPTVRSDLGCSVVRLGAIVCRLRTPFSAEI